MLTLVVDAEADDMLALAQTIAGGDPQRVQVFTADQKTLFLAAGFATD